MTINITGELGKVIIESDKHIAECIAAGKDEPDSSLVRSSWKSVGSYLPPRKNEVVKTTWRR